MTARNQQTQKQALQILAERAVAGRDSRIGDRRVSEATDRRATEQRRHVLAGTVTGVATKNGLNGAAIRMEGMDKPVMIFTPVRWTSRKPRR